MSQSQRYTLHWDFFGPQAEPTARHFLKHLDEFLEREALQGCQTGVAASRPGQCAAWCETPAEHEAAIVGGLKPKRKTLPLGSESQREN